MEPTSQHLLIACVQACNAAGAEIDRSTNDFCAVAPARVRCASGNESRKVRRGDRNPARKH